jgi:hypothetical protein
VDIHGLVSYYETYRLDRPVVEGLIRWDSQRRRKHLVASNGYRLGYQFAYVVVTSVDTGRSSKSRTRAPTSATSGQREVARCRGR